ncbi:S24 family peptidase [Agrobacterium sp. CCNWLW32]|uniref:LexA family protein n=1 Tax=Agrobacterium TaxID=357 RepID=UPI00300FE694
MSWIVRHEASTFWWKVSGDGLHDIGIQDGDWIGVDRTGKARPGRVVLAVHEG